MSKHKYDYMISDTHIYILEEDGKIVGVSSLDEDKNGDYEKKETQTIKKLKKQLEEYFAGKRKVFEVPLDVKGTEFQLKVWDALLNIPYGETKTYKEIAIDIGNEKACRAVGNANNKNPISIIVP